VERVVLNALRNIIAALPPDIRVFDDYLSSSSEKPIHLLLGRRRFFIIFLLSRSRHERNHLSTDHHNQRNPTTMSKLTLAGLALPLFLLFASPQASGPKAFAGTKKLVQSQEHGGTLQKMIVENGSVTMELDLNRLNGIASSAQSTAKLQFAVAANSFFSILVFNDLLRGADHGSMALVPQNSASDLPVSLSGSIRQLVMEDIVEKLRQSTDYIRKLSSLQPKVGIVLGSGLGNLAKEIEVEVEIEYDDIPHFPVSTVEGHHGKLIIGKLSGKPIVAMAGRFHFYEGYSASEVAYPIRVMRNLGISHLMISNAAGGVNAQFKVGDIMIITDHISFATVNPLVGANVSAFGPRFPDMSEPYKKVLIAKAKSIAAEEKIDVKEGVYFGVTGPTFETRAEYKMIRLLGGDAVGMSTVQEVIAANHMGLPVFAMSVITDIGIREEENRITHEDVLHAAKEAEPKVTTIFRKLIASL